MEDPYHVENIKRLCVYIFNRKNPQNSEPQNGPRRGLDFIALALVDVIKIGTYHSTYIPLPRYHRIFYVILLKPKL